MSEDDIKPPAAVGGALVPPTTQLPSQSAASLSARDRETAEELSRFHPELAGLFRLGFELVGRLEDPGTVFLVGHVGRELANAVERYLAGEDPRSAPLDEATEAPGRERNRERIAAVLRLPPAHALVSRWFELKKLFVSSCHYGATPSAQQLRLGFAELAELLYGRVAPYFSTHRELDALAQTPRPTAEQVSRARALLLRPQQRHYFFSKLKDASWLKPLTDAGQFDVPPDIEQQGDGSWRPQAWPEGRYLIGVAAVESALVADVLVRVPSTNKNPAVWSAVVDAARSMPASEATKLVPGILGALENAPAFVFPHDAIDLVRRLAEGGQQSAFRLADALLWMASEETAAPAEQRSRSAGRNSEWVLPRLSLWELGEFCARAVPALEQLNPRKAVQLLARKLARAVHLVQTSDPDEGRDGRTRYWCRDLEDVSHPDDVREVLAVALAGAASKAAAANQESAAAVWKLLRGDIEIFTRVRWVVLAAAGPLLQAELDEVVGSDRLLDPAFGAREGAALLRKQFHAASLEARDLFRHALERGPELEDVKRSLEFERERVEHTGGSDSADLLARVVLRWQAKRIRWFHDLVPEELKPLASRASVLPSVPSREQQDLDEVGFHTGTASWVGPDPSPISQDALRVMPPPEIVAFLQSWTGPQESFRTGPSLSGLDAALSEVARADAPKAVATAALVVTAGARPQHAAALLDGLATVKLGNDAPWHEYLAGLVAIVRAMGPRLSGEPSHSWRSLLRSVLQVLGPGASSGAIPLATAPAVWELLEESIRTVPELIDPGQERTPETFGDIISASVNSLSGDAASRVVDVALWVYRESTKAHAAAAASQADVLELERRVVPLIEQLLALGSGSATRDARAVLGQFVPQLMLVAPGWMKRMEDSLFSSGIRNPLSDPLWPSYIVRGGVFDTVFVELRRWYVSSAEAEWAIAEDADKDWSPAVGLARHVMIAVVRGVVRVGDEDRLAEKAFSKVSAAAKAKIYDELDRDWAQATSPVPAEFAAHVGEFWAWRLSQLEAAPPSVARSEEAEGLLSFVGLPYVAAAAKLPLSVRTARLLDQSRRTRNDAWAALGELASADANQAFEVIEILVARELARDHAYLPFERIAPALRLSLQATDANVRLRATRLVHLLGERGHEEFGSLLVPT